MTGAAPGNNISAYHFGDYVFDVKRRELIFCADKDNEQSARVVRLSSAESLIFSYLLDHQDEVCDKDLLLDIGWLGRPISPNSLNVAIANIRRHFVSSPQTLDIRSTPKKGYSLHLNCKMKCDYGKPLPTESEPLPEPVSEPTSVKESGSVQALMRSRTVSLPAALWRATLSSPPIFAASAWRYAISSTSGCQLMSLPPAHKTKHNPCQFAND